MLDQLEDFECKIKINKIILKNISTMVRFKTFNFNIKNESFYGSYCR